LAITKKTEYAIRALYEIAITGNEKPVQRKLISKKQNISEHLLEQIFISLQKEGIVKSVRGPGGGFLLSKNMEDITVWDIFRIIDKKENFYDKCGANTNHCTRHTACKINDIWLQINSALKESMLNISLKDIVEK
jgi:Rrf2 family iron-sulfur cluster assembly transcriptional regulator